jgi:hypothetical protein
MGEVRMSQGKVGESRGSKEMDGCPLTSARTTEVSKLEEVPDDSLAVYSGCMVHNPDGIDNLRVGHDSIPLRSIFLLVKGKLTVECTPDPGCQIVAMNSAIWEKLGNNLQVERALKMEATNPPSLKRMAASAISTSPLMTLTSIFRCRSCQMPPMTSSLAVHSTPSQNASPKTLLMKISTLLSQIPIHSNVSRFRQKNRKDIDVRTRIFSSRVIGQPAGLYHPPLLCPRHCIPPSTLIILPRPLVTKSVCPRYTIKNSDPPSHRETESPVLLTEKTIWIKEKAISISIPASVSVSDELSESLLPFSLSLDS